MHLSISAKFTLKEPPDGYQGLVSQQITWARKEGHTFYWLAKAILGEILDWFAVYVGRPDLEKDRDKLVKWLQEIQFREPEKGEDDGGQRIR